MASLRSAIASQGSLSFRVQLCIHRKDTKALRDASFFIMVFKNFGKKMNEVFVPLLRGCMTGAGLIIAIGAQNAFVLKQGILKNKVFVTALFCALADALLISLGVGGVGTLLAQNQILLTLAKWGGAAFLGWYGLKSFRAFFSVRQLEIETTPSTMQLTEILLTLCALTFLNPHVYLDTVVLLGSIGAQFPECERIYFALGAMAASVIWFFGLSYGARLLAPLFQKSHAWKFLDLFVAIVMWITAAALLLTPLPTELCVS